MDETATAPEANIETKKFGRDRYSPGRYELDCSFVKNTPLKLNGQDSTFEAVYTKLRESKIIDIPWSLGFRDTKYVTDKGDMVIEAEDWRILSVIQKLAGLLKQEINPYEVTWFYYDHDWSRDADECHVFFAVHNDRVVLESCHFNAEEPLILKEEKEDDPVWHSHRYFAEASVQYWYQRFYTQTMTGQLMVLRPDEPMLYYFHRPTIRDVAKDVEFVTIIKLYRLLWVVVALLFGLVFSPLREIMGIVGALLLVDVLWRAWATRKIGSND
jgi:hypothetical protein